MGKVPVAGGRHDRGEREGALRPVRRHQLGDHAAHGDADDVRALDSQGVQQSGRVGGHVVQGVGDRRLLAGDHGGDDRADVRRAGGVDLFGKAHIAVVEHDDPVAARRELVGEGAGPAGQLPAQAHDQQHGLGARIAEAFVFQAQSVGLDLGHPSLRFDEMADR